MKQWLKILFLFVLAPLQRLAAQPAVRFDVLITEIMADPSPAVGLPNAEYIEIKNISSKSISLNGWKISDASATTTINTSVVLLPDSILIICANSQVAHFSVFGRTVGVSSFPSLDNEGDIISLRSAQGKNIHAVAYSSSWYQNAIKKDGGWSLEMMDTNNPCAGMLNWGASIHPSGGTPGQPNSVKDVVKDEQPPQLLHAISMDSSSVLVYFDEPLDSLSASDPSRFNLTEGIQVLSSAPQDPLFQAVLLGLSKPLDTGKIYRLMVQGVKDCSQNVVGGFNEIKTGRPSMVEKKDIVINEILFNPKENGVDFVELYNNSQKVLDVSSLFIANKNASGQVANAVKCSEQPFYIFPGEYLALTTNPVIVQSQYLVPEPRRLIKKTSMPSYPDDKGTVVITGSQGAVIDEVTYSEKWHFALISNAEGISLERLNASSGSDDPGNWHSASSTIGYATPGYKNSQQSTGQSNGAVLEVMPKLFSPDNDGYEDLASIIYQVQDPGYIANITVFDVQARPVRSLVRSGLMGLKGHWNWDGLDDKKQKLPPGNYIIHAEIFNLQGKKKGYKMVVVLARKFE